MMSVSKFKLRLTLNDEQVYNDLAREKPKTMEDLMKRIEDWNQLHESKV